MARMRMLLPALLAIALVGGCERGGQGWTKYTDPQAAYGLTYPAHWKADSNPLPQASFSATGTGGDEGLSCSLYHERHAELKGVETEVALASVSEDLIKAGLLARYKDVNLTERERATLSNLPARHFIATYQVRRTLGGTTDPYMGDMLVTVANGGFYSFFCGGPVADYAAAGERIGVIRASVAVFPQAP